VGVSKGKRANDKGKAVASKGIGENTWKKRKAKESQEIKKHGVKN